MSGISQRKTEHIEAVLAGGDTRMSVTTGLERVRFVNNACPELSLDEIDLEATLVGRRLSAPLLISSMTGGPDRAERINTHLAEAAQALGLALGVGSQRVALEGDGASGLGSNLRALAPDIALLANLGAAQIIGARGTQAAQAAVEMINADALIVHLNSLQEAVQDGGDRDWRGVLSGLEAVCRALPVPVVAKEVGAGISGAIARRLVDAGVQVIDVAGAGGTSWAGVEAARSPDPHRARIAATFRDWGIPTAEALRQVRVACPRSTGVIASGGIRTGLDAARAIRLGADCVGQAAHVLEAATQSTQAVIDHFNAVIAELRIACFCTGSANLAALRTAPVIEP